MTNFFTSVNPVTGARDDAEVANRCGDHSKGGWAVDIFRYSEGGRAGRPSKASSGSLSCLFPFTKVNRVVCGFFGAIWALAPLSPESPVYLSKQRLPRVNFRLRPPAYIYTHMSTPIRRNRFLSRSLAGAAAILFLAGAVSAQGFQRIFDGTSLKGWHKLGNATWTIADSAIVGTAANGQESYLVSDLTAKDFGLRLKFWWTSGNGGVNFRNLEKNGISNGIQVDLDGANTSGSLYDNEKAKYVAEAKKDSLAKWFKPNAWNDLAIEAQGTRIIVTLNGKQTVDFQDVGGHAEGVFAFQMHVGQTMNQKFKDIELRDDSKNTGIVLAPARGALKAGARWYGALPILSLEMLLGRK
jgi:hypothetical protein